MLDFKIFKKMNRLDLNALGVSEMSQEEMVVIEGGNVFQAIGNAVAGAAQAVAAAAVAVAEWVVEGVKNAIAEGQALCKSVM